MRCDAGVLGLRSWYEGGSPSSKPISDTRGRGHASRGMVCQNRASEDILNSLNNREQVMKFGDCKLRQQEWSQESGMGPEASAFLAKIPTLEGSRQCFSFFHGGKSPIFTSLSKPTRNRLTLVNRELVIFYPAGSLCRSQETSFW